MKSKYSFENRGAYLYMRMEGNYNTADSKVYPTIMREICEKENVYQILLDGQDVDWTDFTTTEKFAFGEVLAKAIAYRMKITVIIPKRFLDGFWETVARNRGVDLVVFSGEKEALKWLEATSTSTS